MFPSLTKQYLKCSSVSHACIRFQQESKNTFSGFFLQVKTHTTLRTSNFLTWENSGDCLLLVFSFSCELLLLEPLSRNHKSFVVLFVPVRNFFKLLSPKGLWLYLQRTDCRCCFSPELLCLLAVSHPLSAEQSYICCRLSANFCWSYSNLVNIANIAVSDLFKVKG